MGDFLGIFARDALGRLSDGYYDLPSAVPLPKRSLVESIRKQNFAAIIAEVKAASPSSGIIRKEIDVEGVVAAMERGGAAGISVLTVPKGFNGHLTYLSRAKSATRLPILMKDFVVGKAQVDAAARLGADAILLISELLERGYAQLRLSDMVAYAHEQGLEVLLETRGIKQYREALKTEAEIVGINNRDLSTLKVDLDVTKEALTSERPEGRIVVSESGISSPEDIRSLKSLGVSAFLVGSSVMMSQDIEEAVRLLVRSV